jgi:hypothetical protein
MNWAHAHLLLNHIPVIGMAIAVPLLSFALVKKWEELKKASLALFVGLALVAIPTYLTGAPAESVVEGLPGVSEAIIEQHEEAALIALVALELLGRLPW